MVRYQARRTGAALCVAVFTLWGAQQVWADDEFIVETPGEVLHEADVRCGERCGRVRVATGVTGRVNDPLREDPPLISDMVSIGWDAEGQQEGAEDCRWVQFVMLTVRARGPEEEGLSMRKGSTPTLRSREIKLSLWPGPSHEKVMIPWTVDLTQPAWHVDSGDPNDPCYGAAGLDNARSGGDRTIFDAPDTPLKASRSINQDMDEVAVEVRFHAYLICDGKPCYRVVWAMTERTTVTRNAKGGVSFNRSGVVTSVVDTAPDGEPEGSVLRLVTGPVDTLPEPQQTALRDQFPGQTTVVRPGGND